MSELADFLNGLSVAEATTALEKCCASSHWISGMLAARPFRDTQTVEATAANVWRSLNRPSYLEAFSAHPRIGDVKSLRAKFANTKGWAQGEQARASEANEETLSQLAEGNDAYLKKFGYIFIVCATGKTAKEMLQILESRLPNEGNTELQIASEEQLKITWLRLQKLIEDLPKENQ